MPTFDERFRGVANWCSSNGFVAGFPTCHENSSVTPTVYGTIVILQGVSGLDVLASTLAFPASAPDRLVATTQFAGTQGKAHGFPNFHQAGSGPALVYGTMLLDASAVYVTPVRVDEVFGTPLDPKTRPLEDWFRACADWAARKGFPAAMPTGDAGGISHGHMMMNVVVFKAGATQFRDLTGVDLKFTTKLTVGPGW